LLSELSPVLQNQVLFCFKSINRKGRSKLSLKYMKKETSEHFQFLIKTFKRLVLPISVCYLCIGFFLGKNVFGSMLWGLLVFCYSHFLPDLPSVFRLKKRYKEKNLVWYKKYALLLLAPVFIYLLFSGIHLPWRTRENFHNLKSLAVYGSFLFLLGLIFYGDLPISSGDMIEIFSPALYGLIGYFTHLKVDKLL